MKILFLFTILAYVIASWILVHLLSVFGFFIAMAYPIWWVIAPHQVICFSCKSKRDGERCKLCNTIVNKNDPTYPNPKTLLSSIKNSFIISFFTIFSIGLIFGEALVLHQLGFPPTPKTVTFVIPEKGQYRLKEIFPMKIEIVGIETPINAVQADIGFDPTNLEVMSISTDESFANIFIQKEIDNETGYARLTGGLPNPGFFSHEGVFGTILFRGKSPGVAEVEFLPTSLVLANDGKGTNVLREFASVSYLILPESVSKEEEEMQKKLITTKATVLGDKNSGTKIRFFDEGSVLGTVAESKLNESQPKKEKFNLISWFANLVHTYDCFILEQWEKILNLINKIFNKDTSNLQ